MEMKMTSKEKKAYIQKLIDEGDGRSWYEIAADLELDIWRKKMKGGEEEDPIASVIGGGLTGYSGNS